MQPLYGSDMQGLTCLETNKRNPKSGSRLLELRLARVVNYNMNDYHHKVDSSAAT